MTIETAQIFYDLAPAVVTVDEAVAEVAFDAAPAEVVVETIGQPGPALDLRYEAGQLEYRPRGGVEPWAPLAPLTPVFIQAEPPVANGPYLWIQTGLGDGSGITFWIEDGE